MVLVAAWRGVGIPDRRIISVQQLVSAPTISDHIIQFVGYSSPM
jgi:hypothetical protein